MARQFNVSYFLFFCTCIFVEGCDVSHEKTILNIPGNRIEYISGHSIKLPKELKQNTKIHFENDWFDFFVNLQLYRYCNNLYFYSNEIYDQAKKYLVRRGKIQWLEEITIRMVHDNKSYTLPKNFYFASVSMPIAKTWIIQNKHTDKAIFGEVNF